MDFLYVYCPTVLFLWLSIIENLWKEQSVQVCLKGAPEFSLPQSCGSKYKLLNGRSSFSSLDDPMSSPAEHY